MHGLESTSRARFDLNGIDLTAASAQIIHFGVGGNAFACPIEEFARFPSLTRGGKFLRMLRHWTAPDCAATPRVEMTGEKMFFPDDFFLSEKENIRFTTGVGKPHLVKRGTPGDNDGFIVYGEKIGFDADGNLCVNFHTLNRLWQTASSKPYHAVSASPDDLDHWQVSPGRVKMKDSPNPVIAEVPAEEKPDWGQKPGPDGKITYRFYDPERDGIILLKFQSDMHKIAVV